MGTVEEAGAVKGPLSAPASGVVVVNPKPRKGLASMLVDALERLIVWAMYDSSKPHHFLSGNFAPLVDKTPPCKDLTVRRQLPVLKSSNLSLPLGLFFFLFIYFFMFLNWVCTE